MTVSISPFQEKRRMGVSTKKESEISFSEAPFCFIFRQRSLRLIAALMVDSICSFSRS